MRKFWFLFILIVFYASCTNFKFNKEKEEMPIAKVNDKYLYPSDLKSIFIGKVNKEDSIIIAKNFINKWIKKQLLLKKAELNLTKEQKDISKEIDEYRTSMIIFRYEEELLNQKFDTLITEDQINNYYNENKESFILDENIVKVVSVIVPKTAPNINKVKTIFKLQKESDIKDLEDYCYQYAKKFDYSPEIWQSFKSIKQELPLKIQDDALFLNSNKYIQTEDSLTIYLVNIIDYKLKDMLAPESFIKEKIKIILLNKRRLQFLQDIENSIYNDGLKYKQFETYN